MPIIRISPQDLPEVSDSKLDLAARLRANAVTSQEALEHELMCIYQDVIFTGYDTFEGRVFPALRSTYGNNLVRYGHMGLHVINTVGKIEHVDDVDRYLASAYSDIPVDVCNPEGSDIFKKTLAYIAEESAISSQDDQIYPICGAIFMVDPFMPIADPMTTFQTFALPLYRGSERWPEESFFETLSERTGLAFEPIPSVKWNDFEAMYEAVYSQFDHAATHFVIARPGLRKRIMRELTPWELS
jgi:hypothetical protein